jgi:alkylation response protein AidB-like acyl-CoA dehydrogenase
MAMSLLHTDEQEQIRQTAVRALAKAYAADRLRGLLETTGEYDLTFWQACREMGWTALAIPQEYEGIGLGLVELTLVAHAAGRVVAGAPFLFSSYAAAQAILLCEDAALKSEVLPLLATGDAIGTVAFGAAGNPVAVRPGGHLVDGALSGTYRGVLAGMHAGLAVLLASAGDDRVLVLVDLDGPTVRRDVLDTFDNSRGMADLTFTGTPARVLVNAGADHAAWSVLDRAAVVLAAEQVGGAEACLELACNYATTRHAFGQPIGKFQAIKHKLAEIYVANEIARANCLEAAFRHDAGLAGFTPLACAARLSATAAYDMASREGIQVFGAIGATWDSDMHLHLRRARSTAALLGERSIWEDRIVATMENAR